MQTSHYYVIALNGSLISYKLSNQNKIYLIKLCFIYIYIYIYIYKLKSIETHRNCFSVFGWHVLHQNLTCVVKAQSILYVGATPLVKGITMINGSLLGYHLIGPPSSNNALDKGPLLTRVSLDVQIFQRNKVSKFPSFHPTHPSLPPSSSLEFVKAQLMFL